MTDQMILRRVLVPHKLDIELKHKLENKIRYLYGNP